jgi:hypothetical protein
MIETPPKFRRLGEIIDGIDLSLLDPQRAGFLKPERLDAPRRSRRGLKHDRLVSALFSR